MAEHHFANLSLSPSPLITLSHLAARTSRIRLGSGVLVLPLYHPMRLVEEIAYVDALSDGRLDLGVIIPFAAGCGVGVVAFSRVVGWALSRQARLWATNLPLGEVLGGPHGHATVENARRLARRRRKPRRGHVSRSVGRNRRALRI